MSRKSMRRILLVVIVLPLVGLVIYYWQRERKAEAARKHWDNVYEAIGQGKYAEKYYVFELMGSEGEMISHPDWPEFLGDMPGYWDKFKEWENKKKEGLAHSTWFPPASTPVHWRIWRVSGRHKWIAIGYVYDGRNMRSERVVEKRSGLDYPFPGD